MSDKPKKKIDKLSKDKIVQYKHIKWLFARRWSHEYLLTNSPSLRAGIEASISPHCSDREEKIVAMIVAESEKRKQEHLVEMERLDGEIDEYIIENDLPALETILTVQGI